MTSNDSRIDPSINEEDPNVIAARAEQDLNSYDNKTGRLAKGASDSTTESGVDESAAARFPGGSVTYGSAASGAGDNREIPDEEGGGINPNTGRQTKAGDFEGIGGPEENNAAAETARGGDQDIQSNVRQGQGQTGAQY